MLRRPVSAPEGFPPTPRDLVSDDPPLLLRGGRPHYTAFLPTAPSTSSPAIHMLIIRRSLGQTR